MVGGRSEGVREGVDAERRALMDKFHCTAGAGSGGLAEKRIIRPDVSIYPLRSDQSNI